MSFQCNKCNKIFKKMVYLKEHLSKNICNKYSTYEYNCPKCDRKYKTNKSLNKHIRDKHANISKDLKKTIIKCPICSIEFSNNSNLKRHLKKYCRNNISNVINNNVTNNINNNINITNNINIQINSFGNESMDNISERRLMNSIKSIDNMPLDYIKLKYIDNPCNRNVYLHDRDDKEMYVFKNGKWVKEDKIKVLNNMLVGAIDDINVFNKNNNSGKRKARLDERLDIIEHENKMDNFQLGRVQNVTLSNKNKPILIENFIKTNGQLPNSVIMA